MIALALALSFLGCLAFAGFVLWLKRRDGHGERMDALQSQIATVEAHLHNHADNPTGQHGDLGRDLKALHQAGERFEADVAELRRGYEEASRITAESTKKALDDLSQRVRGCELKAGIPTQRRGSGNFADEFLRTGGLPENAQS